MITKNTNRNLFFFFKSFTEGLENTVKLKTKLPGASPFPHFPNHTESTKSHARVNEVEMSGIH